MSNDLITYSANVPDFLKEAGGYRDEGMTAGIAPKAPKLAVTTAKQWTITDNGQTQILPSPSVKGVIIASSGTLTKAWYEKAYVPGTNAAPDCFSNDGKVPAPGCAKPQSSNCAQCPKNAFGSHPVTGRGKACGDRKMIVLALDSMPDKYATFNIPTMSLGSLREIDGKLKSSNIPLQSVMMEFTFDPGVLYPVVKIGAVGFIGKEHFEKFRDAADSDEVRDLLREVDYEAAEVPAQQPVVPNNQIAFGTGGQVAQQPAEEPKAPELTEKEKKIAAAKAALAALEEEEGGQGDQQVQQTQATDVLGGAQNHTTGSAVASATAPAQRRRRTKAEMEAARAEEAARAAGVVQTGNAMESGVATVLATETGQIVDVQVEQAAQQTPAPAATGGAPNVLDLLSKWATKA